MTKPPLLAWAAWKLYEIDHDREFLDEIYEPIVRWNDWWFEHNDVDGNGLCEYQHPYSSGLDDSPLWDDGMPVESPDLEHVSVFAAGGAGEDRARASAKSTMWRSGRSGADAMAARMVRWMWDEKAGLFWATRPNDGSRVNVRTPFSLFPLLTGRLPARHRARGWWRT